MTEYIDFGLPVLVCIFSYKYPCNASPVFFITNFVYISLMKVVVWFQRTMLSAPIETCAKANISRVSAIFYKTRSFKCARSFVVYAKVISIEI